MLLSTKKLLAFTRLVVNNLYGIYDPYGVRLINRLRLGLGNLGERKFRQNLADTLNPFILPTTLETKLFFLHCKSKLSSCTTLMNELDNISNAINYLNSTDFIWVTLYGDKNFDNVTNFKIMMQLSSLVKPQNVLKNLSLKLPIC